MDSPESDGRSLLADGEPSQDISKLNDTMMVRMFFILSSLTPIYVAVALVVNTRFHMQRLRRKSTLKLASAKQNSDGEHIDTMCAWNEKETLKNLATDYFYFRPSDTDFFCYPVSSSHDNHNPLLPLPLRKRLDEMSPREYLTYVLGELTLEERESLMVDERERSKTFLVNWPHENNPSGVQMAQAGFYCVDDYDRVQCVFCRGKIHNWKANDNPMTEHALFFNFCRFMKGLECGNRSYTLLLQDCDNIILFGQLDALGGVPVNCEPLGISINKADTVQYAPEPTRRTTFARWPAGSAVNTQQLCEAGFYFTEFEDQVRCFYCSGELRDWKPNDDPWEEHARWFPECSFLNQSKGEEYVNNIHATTPANKKCTRSTPSKGSQVKRLTVNEARSEELSNLQRSNTIQSHNLQADMVDICRRLGHSLEVINKAISLNGGPFDDIKMLVDMIDCLEYRNDNDSGFTSDSDIAPVLRRSSTQRQDSQRAEQELQRIESDRKDMQDLALKFGFQPETIRLAFLLKPEPFESVSSFIDTLYAVEEGRGVSKVLTLGNVTEADVEGSYPEDVGNCVLCYKNTGQIVKASRIGLPCAHMILCVACADMEMQSRAANPRTYKPKCPYRHCVAPLIGLFKTCSA